MSHSSANATGRLAGIQGGLLGACEASWAIHSGQGSVPNSGQGSVLLLIRVGAIWVAVLIVCEADPKSPGCLFTHDSVP